MLCCGKLLSQDTDLPAQLEQFDRVRVPIQSVILSAERDKLTYSLIAFAGQLRVLSRERGLFESWSVAKTMVESLLKITWLGPRGVAMRLSNLKSPPE